MGRYRELARTIKIRILNGTYAPGSRLPSIRELSSQFGCNPNTMYQALNLLRADGLILSERAVGYNVIDSAEIVEQIKQDEFLRAYQEMKKTLMKMGYSKEQLDLSIVNTRKEHTKEHKRRTNEE